LLKTYFIPPHSSLASYIDDYILCTSENISITFNGSWAASNETSLSFYLADKPQSHITECKDSILANKSNCLVGLLTRHNGMVNFTGSYHTFIIQFKANGLNTIFRMPMYEFTDKIFTAEDVFGKQTNALHEQLLNAADIQQMASFADNFLLSFLNKQKKIAIAHDGITAIAKELYNTTSLLSVAQYASKANMSIRTFERRFTEQAGVSCKFYTKLMRFNEAVKIKSMQPKKTWTSIAYDCGYFDQMHLIKAFKQFANESPSSFFSRNADLTPETFIKVERISL
jgi:AraC-like DNA-binding protein